MALQVHSASQCFEVQMLSSSCTDFTVQLHYATLHNKVITKQPDQIQCTISTEKAEPTANPRVRKKDMTTPVASASSRGTTFGP